MDLADEKFYAGDDWDELERKAAKGTPVVPRCGKLIAPC